ncbi:MAG: 2-amino-3,7-dideoxy-D-threo-hept-6-ulosonate synthase [Clostridia bacterium]|nr:2-amino-3,7-dideoxy-D-threo-hept-6-ulosonate synthase [Clostridia bacterium]
MSGKDIRLKQLFKHSQHIFVLPMDHGITVGPMQGIEDIRKVSRQVSGKVDALLVHKGMVNQIADCLAPEGCNLIIHLSASTSLAPDPNKKELVTSVEHAMKMGASAVSVHVNLGAPSEADMLRDLGRTAELCESWGIPLMAMMYVRDGSSQSEYDSAKIKHAARAAEELGADIVKVNYSGAVDTFSEVVKSVRIPVVIAGGPKASSDFECLNMINDCMKAGAMGVAIGRNIFQHQNPDILSGAIRNILDNKLSEAEIKELAAKCSSTGN